MISAKLQSLLIVLSLLIIPTCAVAYYSEWEKPVEAVTPEIIYSPAALLKEANRLRAEKGVAPLVIDERLNQSAQWKADDMKEFGYFGHVKPGETVNNGAQLIYDKTRQQDGNSECIQASENLQKNSDHLNPFTGDGWISSKPHYEAIIDTRYETTGFGIVQSGNDI